MYSNDLKHKVVQLREDGLSYRKIAQILHLSVSVVHYMCKKRNNIDKKRGPKSKISTKYSRKIKRSLQKMVNNNEKITARKVIDSESLNVSKSTVQRYLRSNFYQYGAIKKEIILSDKHKQSRTEICKSWLKQNIDFNKVVMSDEKKFNLDGPDGWFSYYPVKGKKQTRQKSQQGGGGLLVSGWIFSDGSFHLEYLTESVNSDNYIHLLKEKIIPLVKSSMKNDYILQQDNATPHTSNKTQLFLKNSGVNVLNWPAKSPDLNITEQVWGYLSEKVYEGPRILNAAQLREKIDHVCSKFKKEISSLIKNAYGTYFARVLKVITLNGKKLPQ